MEELAPSSRLPADVESAAHDPARRWGPFVLLKELGRGANGVVTLCYDLRLHRRVAVKTLLNVEPLQFERFSREAQAVAKLEHPGIVRVLDLAIANGRPYMAMEVLEGQSLRQYFRDQSLRTRQLVSILKDVAEALGFAHTQGIVHRDVKPGNIFVDNAGRGRIMDFGVARDIAAAGEDLTATGQALGTPEYMSPEQASDARQVSPRSDVYSLGVVLFEGLTGRPPFLGSTPVETMFKVMSENLVRPSALSEVPMVLEEVILRCLDRDPQKRFMNGAALAAALGRFLESRQAVASKQPSAKAVPAASAASSATLKVVLGVAVALAALGVGGWFAWRGWQAHQAELAALERRHEQQRLVADAERAAKDRARLDAERKRARAKAVAEALKRPDPQQRIPAFDAYLVEAPKDARILAARALAKNDVREDLIARGLPTDEIDEAIRRDIDAALAADPSSAAAFMERARLASAKGDAAGYSAAIAAAEQTGVAPDALYAAMLIQAQRGTSASPQQLDELVRAHPDYAYGWGMRGSDWLRRRNLAEARDAYAHSLELDERSAVRGELVRILWALGDWDAVVEESRKWLAIWPGTPEAQKWRGDANVRKGDGRAALEDAKRLIDEKSLVLGHELAAEAHYVLRDMTSLLAECDALLALPALDARGRVIALCYKAAVFESKGDLDGAAPLLIDAAAVAVTLDTAATVARTATPIAQRLLSERGDTDAAEKLLHRLCQTRVRALSFYQDRVRVALAAGELGTARKILGEAKQLGGGAAIGSLQDAERLLERCYSEIAVRTKAIQTAAARGDESARVDRAVVMASLGDENAAKDELERLAKDAREPATRAHALLAHARYFPPDDNGAKEIDDAVALVPADGLPLAERAVLAARLHREAAAREDSARALALSPKDAMVHARVAEAALVLGDLDGAVAEANAALALDASAADALQVRMHVAEKRGDVAAQARDLRALAPFQLYSIREELLRRRADWLEKSAR